MPLKTPDATHWFAAEDDPSHRMAVFPTQFGWIGLLWNDSRLTRSAFSHASARSAHSALLADPAINSLRWRELPTELQGSTGPLVELAGVVRRLQQFTLDFQDDLTDIRLDWQAASAFQRRVLEACRAIPIGTTVSYAELARRAGSPGAARAVGNVMASNRFAPIVPCHRVIGKEGGLRGYSAPGGLSVKQRLLAAEARAASD